jgi:hypothetical protein
LNEYAKGKRGTEAASAFQNIRARAAKRRAGR